MNYFDFGFFRPKKNVAYGVGTMKTQGPVDRQALAQNVSDMLLRRGGVEPAPGLMGGVQGMAPGMFNRQPQAMPQGGMYGGVVNLAQQRTGQPVIEEEPIYPAFFKAFNLYRRR
jgi:hypothetical protein